jgi:hypothetical protein
MVKVISGIGSTLRPAAKQLIKGGLVATNAITGLATDTGGQFKVLVSEARSELRQSQERQTATGPAEHEGLWDRMIDAGNTVADTATSVATSIMSTANEAITMVVVWFTGESKGKAKQQVEKAEEKVKEEVKERPVLHFVRDVSRDLAKDEVAYVIETMILMAA